MSTKKPHKFKLSDSPFHQDRVVKHLTHLLDCQVYASVLELGIHDQTNGTVGAGAEFFDELIPARKVELIFWVSFEVCHEKRVVGRVCEMVAKRGSA